MPVCLFLVSIVITQLALSLATRYKIYRDRRFDVIDKRYRTLSLKKHNTIYDEKKCILSWTRVRFFFDNFVNFDFRIFRVIINSSCKLMTQLDTRTNCEEITSLLTS